MLRYLITAMILLALFSCADEEETLKIKRNIANVQEQIYKLEGQQVEARREVLSRLEKMERKLENRTAVADTKDELHTVQQKMSEHWALLEDLERHMASLQAEVRKVPLGSGDVDESSSSSSEPALNSDEAPMTEVAGNVVQGQYRQAYMDYNRGKYDVAIEGFRGILSSYPKSAFTEKSNYYLANCLFQTEKFQEARELYSRIAKDEKGDFTRQAMYYEGRCFYSLNQLSKAIISLRDLTTKYPGTQEAELATNFLKQTGYER